MGGVPCGFARECFNIHTILFYHFLYTLKLIVYRATARQTDQQKCAGIELLFGARKEGREDRMKKKERNEQ